MHKTSISEKAPLFFPFIAIGFSALFYSPDHYLSYSTLFLVLSGLLLLHVFYKKIYIIWMAFFVFGMLWLSHEYELIKKQDSFQSLDNELVHLRGTIKEVPFFDAQKTFEKDRKVNFIVSLDQKNSWQRSFEVRVNLFDFPDREYLPGDKVDIKGRFRRPSAPTVPNGFDSRKYYRENDRIGVIRVTSVDQIKIVERPFSFRKIVYLARGYIYQKLNKNLPKEAGAFYTSLIIGDRSGFDNDLIDDFRQWGISHIFAISGLHMGLLALWAWWVSGFVFISLRKKAIFTMFIPLVYCVISGAGFSAIRAFIMLGCFLGGYLLQRRSNTWNSFALAFILIFLWKPFSVFNAGFQMSFVAVATIVMTNKIFKGLFDIKGVHVLASSFYQKQKKEVLSLFFYSFMISTATMLVVAYHFNMVSIAGVFLNIVIIPVFSILLGMAFIFMIMLPIIPSWLYFVLDWSYQAFEFLPVILTLNQRLHFFCTSPSLLFVVVGVLVFFGIPLVVKEQLKRIYAYGILHIVLCGYLYFWGYEKLDRITILDTGKASAAVVQGADGFCAVIDCGTVTGYDLVGPYLRSIGSNRIEGVFVSHDNFDHFSNFPNLAHVFSLKKVYINTPATEATQLFFQVQKIMKNRSSHFAKGDSYHFNDHSFKGLHPDESVYKNKNEESQIILYESEYFQVLFTGDAQKEGLDALLKTDTIPQKAGVVRVMIMPHHGRNVFRVENLLEWYSPDFVLTSGDRYTANVLEVLEKLKVEHYITAKYGTLELRVDGLYSFHNNQWSVVKKFTR